MAASHRVTESRSLEETVALLEATLSAIAEGILVVGLNREILLYNSQYLKMFGFTSEELERGGTDLILRTLRDQIENPEVLVTDRESLRNYQGPTSHELRFKDGRVFERYLAPHNVRGELNGVVLSYRDVSDRVRGKQVLDQYRAFLEKAQEVAHIGSWVAELDGSDHLGWSAETHRIFGVSRTEFASTVQAFYTFVHHDDRDLIRRRMASALAGEAPYDLEHRIVTADGRIKWVHEKADVVRDSQGRPVRVVGTVRDITEQRLLEEQLRQSQKLEAIGRLSGGVAHDLNNALTAIAGYTELALGELDESSQVRRDVEEIRRAAERAEAVTKQLLAFSRKQALEPRVFSLKESVVNLTLLLGRLLGGTIELQTTVDSNVPPIYGDPGRIEQAIINLAVNARDAMPAGGQLTLAISTVEADEAFVRVRQPMRPGRYVRLSVVDTGEGMTPETEAHIFEPFFTTKRAGRGTGLGLAMVYGTVKQIGGFIFVDSQLGQGTAFHLFFPAPPAASAHEAPASRTAGAMVLVVDEEPAVRNLVVTALSRQGYRVQASASPSDALAKVEADPAAIDLVLADASLSGTNGAGLVHAFTTKYPDLSLIVMSSDGSHALSVPEVGRTVPVLAKPFTPSELGASVAVVLARRTARTDLR